MKIKYLGVVREGCRLLIEFQEVESKRVRSNVEYHPTEESAATRERLISNNLNRQLAKAPRS